MFTYRRTPYKIWTLYIYVRRKRHGNDFMEMVLQLNWENLLSSVKIRKLLIVNSSKIKPKHN